MSRCLGVLRIIPAYAGSTRELVEDLLGVRDHPRIRGEHPAASPNTNRALGSSPHTRGARTVPVRVRSISSDHPRIRGEHTPRSTRRPKRRGSSPHTRGARRDLPERAQSNRIIPAYAGSTRLRPGDIQPHWDHPRIRGEHGRFDARGIQRPRIIPAYAGSTLSFHFFAFWSQDHPRIRGEHAQRHDPKGVFTGSSPHTRGARGGVLVHLPDAGIIPAYAGSTFLVPFLSGLCQDHPRIRGEHYLS